MIRLEYLRLKAGLSPEQLADALGDDGITGRQIRRIEQGATPRPATRLTLANHFGVSSFAICHDVDPDELEAAA